MSTVYILTARDILVETFHLLGQRYDLGTSNLVSYKPKRLS